MKKYSVFLLISVSLTLLAGCGKNSDASDPSVKGDDSGSVTSPDSQNGGYTTESITNVASADGTDQSVSIETVTCQFRIVDGAQSGFPFLAGQNSGDIYTLSLKQETPVYLDGCHADASVLEDGMLIDIEYDGSIMETFPAQFGQISSINAYSRGTEQNPGGSYYDLCGFYLQVLDDLWDTDPGLNSEVRYISVDLSQAPGELTEGEKQAIAWIFAGKHNAESLTFSYNELVQEGYLTAVEANGSQNLYHWEDGILFTITPGQWEENEIYSLPVLKFNAEKWRSPRGAYFFIDCFAIWPEIGTWSSYEIGNEAVS